MADLRLVLRLLKMHHAQRRALETYSENLRKKVVESVDELPTESSSGLSLSSWPALHQAATTARKLDQASIDRLFSTLPADMADELEREIYSFAALPGLPGRSVQEVLRRTPARDLALSLINAPSEIEAAVLDNVSARAATMIREDRESLISSGEVASSDVAAAQNRISEIIRMLVRQGENG